MGTRSALVDTKSFLHSLWSSINERDNVHINTESSSSSLMRIYNNVRNRYNICSIEC